MKAFFKSVLASCLGVTLAFVLVFFLLMGIGLSLGGSKVKSKVGILKLDLSHTFPEKTDNVQKSPFNVTEGDDIGLRDAIKLIEKAKMDENIKGILINSSSNSNGLATSESISNALEDFKSSGKFIYAYADMYSQGAYIISTVADSVFLNPNGGVDLKGFAVMYPFYKGFLDKIGVKFDVFYAGQFKSASEPYRRTDMSPQNKLQTKEFLDEMFHLTSQRLLKNRHLTSDAIDSIINQQLGMNAKTSLSSRLVDKLYYWDELETLLKQKSDVSDDKKINYITLDEYQKSAPTAKDIKVSGDKIAVLFAEGEVVYGKGEDGSISDQRYIKLLEKIKKDNKIKALVLRVNSGGGSALTSDIIWREIETIKAKGIPVIASFGDYAASGGYYIACGADSIVAMPTSLTGSIGVFSMLPNTKQLFNEKLGITFDTVKTHTESIQGSAVYDLTNTQKKRLQESTDDIYSQFLERVSVGRHMPKDSVHVYAQGRIWSGNRAKEIGLVDEIGDLNRAIEIAAEKAGISDSYRVVEYPKIEKSFFEQMVKEIATSKGEEDESIAMLKYSLKDLLYFKKIISQNGVQARLPCMLEIE